MSEESKYSGIELELQVRLMNLVMGEASDFERDQLHSMMEERSELATYFRSIERVHGMLCEVGAGDPSMELGSSNEEDAWQLSADRREKVLAALDNQSPDPPGKVTLANKSGFRHLRVRFLEAVAVAAIGCVLVGLMLPSVQSARRAAARLSVGASSKTASAPPTNDAAPSPFRSQAAASTLSLSDENSVPNVALGSRLPSDDFAYGTTAGKAVVPQGVGFPKGDTASTSIDPAEPYRQWHDDEANRESSLMMTITPRIIIPKEHENELGESTRRYRNDPPADGERFLLERSAEDWVERDAVWKLEQQEEKVPSQRLHSSNSQSRLDGLSFFHDATKILDSANVENRDKSLLDSVTAKDEVSEEVLNLHATVESDWKKLKILPSLELAKGTPTAPQPPVALDEQSASTEAFSTFSLHVSDVSFKLAQAALSQGQWPDAAQIRIEEFVNAMDYHDPLPSGNEKVACRIEQAIHPCLMQRNLLRVSMKTAATGRSLNTPLRLTLLLDNSGSMERPDRRQAVLRAFQTLTQQLSATDQVTLISFASTPRLLADKVPGNQGEALLQLIENLPSEGGTNIESALLLAHEKAAEQQLAGAQNRIVLLTDGAVNLGDADPDSLARLVTRIRDAGIAFDAAGISAQDLNDQVLEALTRQGDGRYYLLDSAASAGEGFAAQIAGALRPSAQNVKVQVEFNPERVGRYKLLGFDKHRLNKEEFRDDQVDAAEMAAAEAGVAVYQYEVKPHGSGDIGSVSVRFRDLSTGQMVERRWPIPFESSVPRLEYAEPSMQLAAGAALFAAKLGGGPIADSVDLADLRNLFARLPEKVANQPRVQQLRTMIDQAMAIGR